MPDAQALLHKHRAKGVLIDTNLLMLLLVGKVNRRRIPEFKRTQNFTIQVFDLLDRLVSWLGQIKTTPHVLAQVSDLTDLSGKELTLLRSLFKTLVTQLNEVYDESRVVCSDPTFARHGLTDAAIATVSARGGLVLTVDLNLHLALERRGYDAINFNHVRFLSRP